MKYIELTQGYKTMVDDEDFEWLNQWKWHLKNTGKNLYAARGIWDNDRGNNRFIRMHRLIMGASGSIQVDHINRNTLDNRRCNLRLCDNAQNHWNSGVKRNNTSGFKGVDWLKKNKKWRARLHFHGKEVHIGCFKNKLDAALAYNEAALKYFGEFARLNKI